MRRNPFDGRPGVLVVALCALAAGCEQQDEPPDSPAYGIVASLTIAAPTTRIAPGDSLPLVATARNPADDPLPLCGIAWSTSDSSVATVSARGLVVGVGAGTAFIEAASEGQSRSVAIAVLDHPDTLVVKPGDDLQAMVNRAPDGTVFRIGAGIHRGQSVLPKEGMTFVGEPGAVLTGDDRVAHAFRADEAPYPHNVVIRGLVIEHYVPALQTGAVRADAAMSAWTIEDCEVRYNAAAGIQLGPNARARRNRVHHNAQIGIVGSGDGIVVEDNEIAFNNPSARYDMYWEAGGTKFVRTRDLVVRRNFVHHNHGPGLWTDIDNVRTLYERNRVEDNAEAGIFHEIGYAAVIRDNETRRNGTHATPADWVSGSGILVNSSRDVEVYGNTVEDNHNGITAIEAHRGRGAYGAYVLRDLHVHDNTVRMRVGVTGIATAGWRRFFDRATYRSRHNRFEAGTYLLPDAGGAPFRWRNARLTPAGWRAEGQDASGRFGR